MWVFLDREICASLQYKTTYPYLANIVAVLAVQKEVPPGFHRLLVFTTALPSAYSLSHSSALKFFNFRLRFWLELKEATSGRPNCAGTLSTHRSRLGGLGAPVHGQLADG